MKLLEKKPLLFLLILLTVGIGLGICQYYPVHQQKSALKTMLNKQAHTMEEIKSHCVQLPILHRQVLDLEARADEYDLRFPSNQQFGQLWQQIAQIMDQNELTDQLVRPGGVECDAALCAIPLEIQCTGTFEQIFEFFRCIEDFERLIRLEEVTIDNRSDFSGRVTLKARARVYYQPTELTQT